MKPTQILPESYLHCYTLDSRQHKIAQGILIFLAFTGLLLCQQIIKWASPQLFSALKIEKGASHLILFIGAIVMMVLLHESIHGLVLWVFTRRFPLFGISSLGNIYVDASGWYLPRFPMLIMLLSPFLLLSLLGIVVLHFSSGALFQMTLWAVLLNAAGAINDLTVAGWVFFQPDAVLLKNTGQTLSIYRTDHEYSAKSGIRGKVRVFMEHYLAKFP